MTINLIRNKSPFSWGFSITNVDSGWQSLNIGVLALQGDFLEHKKVLEYLGAKVREIRLPQDLVNIHGLIIPGGESTTLARLIDRFDLRELIRQKIGNGMPTFATCAGLIMLASNVHEDKPLPLKLLGVEVKRNAYGRQVNSLETDITAHQLGTKPFHAIFIRAPVITSTGENVSVLAKFNETPVAVEQNQILATTFHPELTNDLRWHEYFLEKCIHNLSI